MYTSRWPAGRTRGSDGAPRSSAAFGMTVTGRSVRWCSSMSPAVVVRDGDDRVGAVEEHPLRPPGEVVQPPQQAHGRRQVARRGAVLVVDEVVQGEQQLVVAAPRSHGLHGREHDVGAQPLDLQGHERLADARRRAHQLPGQLRQHLELAVVAHEHGERMPLAELGDDARGEPADAVVPADAGVAAVDDDPHACAPERRNRRMRAGGVARRLVVDEVPDLGDHLERRHRGTASPGAAAPRSA